MAGLRFTELQSRPLEFLDFTSVTLDEFQQLVLPFETAFHTLGDAPARSLSALAQRLGIPEADAATVVTPQAEEATPLATTPATAPASPLLPMTGPSGASSAPRTRLNRRAVIVARKRITRSKMSCWS